MHVYYAYGPENTFKIKIVYINKNDPFSYSFR